MAEAQVATKSTPKQKPAAKANKADMTVAKSDLVQTKAQPALLSGGLFQSAQASESADKSIFRPSIQTKLKVGQPGDKYEQEADHMADQVAQMKSDFSSTSQSENTPSTTGHLASQVTPLIQKQEEERAAEVDHSPQENVLQEKSESNTVQRREEDEAEQDVQAKEENHVPESEEQAVQTHVQREEEEEALQRKGDKTPGTSTQIESQINASKGSGQRLGSGTLGQMNNAFGTDFSGVNIHTDQRASQLSRQLNARAFTVGSDVYFNSGQYNPESAEGQHLLAHELTHTIQQGSVSQVQRAPIIQREGNDEAIDSFLKSTVTGMMEVIELELSIWEGNNPGHTPAERQQAFVEIRNNEIANSRQLNDEEYLEAVDLNLDEVKARVTQLRAEMDAYVESELTKMRAVDSYPKGYEKSYEELKQLVDVKIAEVRPLTQSGSNAKIKSFYILQLQELTASKVYFDKEDSKKYPIQFTADPLEYLEALKKRVGARPIPYSESTYLDVTANMQSSLSDLIRSTADIKNRYKEDSKSGAPIDFDLLEAVFLGGDGTKEEQTDSAEGDGDSPLPENSIIEDSEDEDLDEEEILEDQDTEDAKDESLNDFYDEIKKIAEEGHIDSSKVEELEKALLAMSPEDRARFLEYLKAQIPGEKTEVDPDAIKKMTVTEALEAYDQLTELEKKILDTNRKLRKDSTNTDGKDIMVDLGELKSETKDGKTAQEHITEMSKAESVLNRIKKQAGVDGKDCIVDLGWSPFLTELSVFYGLLAGGGKRSDPIRDLSTQLMLNLKELRTTLTKEILLTAGLTVATSFATPALQALAIGHKLNKIRKLIEVGEKVYNIKEKGNAFLKIIQDDTISKTLEDIDAKMAKVQELEEKMSKFSNIEEEDLEEELYKLEEGLREELIKLVTEKGDSILQFLYIPEEVGEDPEAMIDEMMKILYDLPKGMASFETMQLNYEALSSRGDPNENELALLALQAVDTGVYLYPFVGFLTEAANTQLQTINDRDYEDTFNRKKSKRTTRRNYKKRPDTDAEKKDNTKKKFARLNTKKYKYEPAVLVREYLSPYADKFEAHLKDPQVAFSNNVWTPEYFKFVARDFYKEIKPKAKKEKITATEKETKKQVKAPAPLFKLTDWDLKGEKFGFRLKVNPDPLVEAEVKTLDYASFVGTGLAYTFSAMGSQKNKRIKKKALKLWLKRNNYQLTYEVDTAGKPIRNEEHLHIRHGKTQKEYLRMENGRIMQQLHTTPKKAFESFIGKRIKRDDQLPEGYLLASAGIHSSRVDKILKFKRNVTAIYKPLHFENGIITNTKPRKTKKELSKLKNHVHKPEPYNYKKAINNMFDIVPGQPEKIKSKYRDQGNKTIAKWTDYLENHGDTNGMQRPKTVKADLGYTINARAGGDKLSQFRLPEMKKSDDNGHIIARRFSAIEFFNNLIPMDTTTNQRGDWSKMENKFARKYVGQQVVSGNYVHVDIAIAYDNADTRRPKNFSISWEERTASHSLQNPLNADNTVREVKGTETISNK